jgi:hypothetical protein
MSKKIEIAIVGGGVAGATLALYLGELGLKVTLFEKHKTLICGPPFCHLHSGGNLYREISDEQCITLLKQSIDFLRFYPFVVDYRPTVIALPITDDSTPDALLPRLELLKDKYEELIKNSPKNKVLGESCDYYKCYDKKEIGELGKREIVKSPKTSDEWMIVVAKNIDLEKIQFPLILVQEYGLNLFRLASGVTLGLKELENVALYTDTLVTNVQKNVELDSWSITYEKDEKSHKKEFDYLINAAGFKTGLIDDMVGVKSKKMVEFKAAYISRCDEYKDILFPEIIFHGKRGTPQGMGQFTPYPDGYFQLHGMTEDITLYKDGLVASTHLSSQPKLNQSFIKKIENSWSKKEIDRRTLNAIKHLSQFIPKFSKAKVASKPLFGVQQIPGDDPTLRVAEVSFALDRYARCEIVKVSSVIDMIDAIIREFVRLGFVPKEVQKKRDFGYLKSLKESEIRDFAKMLCEQRGYLPLLANRNVSNN